MRVPENAIPRYKLAKRYDIGVYVDYMGVTCGEKRGSFALIFGRCLGGWYDKSDVRASCRP